MPSFDRNATAAEMFGKAKEAYEHEMDTLGMSPRAMAQKVLDENAHLAAHTIVHLAQAADNERIQLDASKYVLERVLGPIGMPATEGTPIDQLVQAIGRGFTPEGFDPDQPFEVATTPCEEGSSAA